MKGLNAGVLLAISTLLQGTIAVISTDIIKAIVSPPMPRLIRIKNTSPKEIRAKDPYDVADFAGLVNQYNYPAEEHNVTTADGYILILHRIPSSPKSRPAKRKPIVFIQHGLVSSSDMWVLMGAGKDIAFLLADAGYDVWLGNYRGNSYSRFHRDISPEDADYWEFSFHELGYYDLPAMIDYILEQTGEKNITYIGHSMGTTTSYVLLSKRPEYNDKMKLVISLAPVAFWRHKFAGVLKFIADNGLVFKHMFRAIGLNEVAPQSRLYSQLSTALCSDGAFTQALCVTALNSLQGVDRYQLNASLFPYIFGYFPAGASRKTLEHYHQSFATGKFRHYNYGYEENLELYHQAEPPEYDLTKITAPVALIYGKTDLIAAKADAGELHKRLPNIIMTAEIDYEFFNHLDFLWANDAKSLVYDDVINLIHKYQ